MCVCVNMYLLVTPMLHRYNVTSAKKLDVTSHMSFRDSTEVRRANVVCQIFRSVSGALLGRAGVFSPPQSRVLHSVVIIAFAINNTELYLLLQRTSIWCGSPGVV